MRRVRGTDDDDDFIKNIIQTLRLAHILTKTFWLIYLQMHIGSTRGKRGKNICFFLFKKDTPCSRFFRSLLGVWVASWCTPHAHPAVGTALTCSMINVRTQQSKPGTKRSFSHPFPTPCPFPLTYHQPFTIALMCYS